MEVNLRRVQFVDAMFKKFHELDGNPLNFVLFFIGNSYVILSKTFNARNMHAENHTPSSQAFSNGQITLLNERSLSDTNKTSLIWGEIRRNIYIYIVYI